MVIAEYGGGGLWGDVDQRVETSRYKMNKF